MSKDPVRFYKEGVSFRLQNQDGLKKWILKAVRENKMTAGDINFIFCSDKYLLKLNRDFLNHNYFTDIITFDNSTEKGNAVADIYISVQRVAVNAKKFKSVFREELHRVMIHGILHLAGYSDKSKSGKNAMRSAEDYWLDKRTFLK